MLLSLKTAVPPEQLSPGQYLYDQESGLVATVVTHPAILDMQTFLQIKPGEVFRILTTRLQSVHDPMKSTLKFLCRKETSSSWVILFDFAHVPEYVIVTNGNKLTTKTFVEQVCPCSVEVLRLYQKQLSSNS